MLVFGQQKLPGPFYELVHRMPSDWGAVRSRPASVKRFSPKGLSPEYTGPRPFLAQISLARISNTKPEERARVSISWSPGYAPERHVAENLKSQANKGNVKLLALGTF